MLTTATAPPAGFHRHDLDKKEFMESLITFPQLKEKRDVKFNLYDKDHQFYLQELLIYLSRPLIEQKKQCVMRKKGEYQINIPAKMEQNNPLPLMGVPTALASVILPAMVGALALAQIGAKVSLDIHLHRDVLVTDRLFKKEEKDPKDGLQCWFEVMGDRVGEGNTHEVYPVDRIIIFWNTEKIFHIYKLNQLIKKRRSPGLPQDLPTKIVQGSMGNREFEELQPLQDASLYRDDKDSYLVTSAKTGVSLDKIDFCAETWGFERRIWLIIRIIQVMQLLTLVKQASPPVFIRVPLTLKKILWNEEEFEREAPIIQRTVQLLAYTWRVEENTMPSVVDDMAALVIIFRKILTDRTGNISVPYWAEDATTLKIQTAVDNFLVLMKGGRLALEGALQFFRQYVIRDFAVAEKKAYQDKRNEICRLGESKTSCDKELHQDLKAIYDRISAPRDEKKGGPQPPPLEEVKRFLASVPGRKEAFDRLQGQLKNLTEIQSTRLADIKVFLGESNDHHHDLDAMAKFLQESRSHIFEEKVTIPLKGLLNVMTLTYSEVAVKPLNILEGEEKEGKKVMPNRDAVQEAAARVLEASQEPRLLLSHKKALESVCQQLRDFPLEFTSSDVEDVNLEIRSVQGQYQLFNEAMTKFFQNISGDKFKGSNSTGISQMATMQKKKGLLEFDKLVALGAEAKSRQIGCRNVLRRMSFFGKGRHQNVDALYKKMESELSAVIEGNDFIDRLPRATVALNNINAFIENNQLKFLHVKPAPKRR